jgi:hypothetical protein
MPIFSKAPHALFFTILKYSESVSIQMISKRRCVDFFEDFFIIFPVAFGNPLIWLLAASRNSFMSALVVFSF